jgi:GNAT superfamily N-acetyltransferase
MSKITIRRAEIRDCDIVYEMLEELRGDVVVPKHEFNIYYNDLIEFNYTSIFLAELNNTVVGMTTFTRLPLPRYCRWYYIFEELVVHKDYRKTGVLFFLLDETLKYLKSDKSAIKVIGVYNGEKQKLLYSRYFENMNRYVLQKILNPR